MCDNVYTDFFNILCDNVYSEIVNNMFAYYSWTFKTQASLLLLL